MTETTGPVRPIGWPTALIGGGLASVVALWLMFWFRSIFQIRTLPERALEYALLFVPIRGQSGASWPAPWPWPS